MHRTDLLARCRAVAKGLALDETVPTLAALFFDGARVRAFNDRVAYTAKCGMPVQAGVPGKPLLAWLAAAPDSEVLVEQGDECVTFKCGRSKLVLASFGLDEYPGPTPRRPRDCVLIPAPHEVLRALELASHCMGLDQAHPWTVGVTLDFRIDGLVVYATDNIAMARVHVAGIEADSLTLSLAPEFVDALLVRAKASGIASLEVCHAWANAVLDDDYETQVWARTHLDAEPDMFEGIIGDLDEAQDGAPFAAAVPELAELMMRAGRIVAIEGGMHVDVEVVSGELRLVSDATRARVREAMPLEGHADVAVRVPPQRLAPFLARAHDVKFDAGAGAVVVRGSHFRAWVSTASPA